MYVVAELRAIDVSSSHQFEEEIGDASSENGLFIAKMEFSVQTAMAARDAAAFAVELRSGSFSRRAQSSQ
jgi:hypothetical protein